MNDKTDITTEQIEPTKPKGGLGASKTDLELEVVGVWTPTPWGGEVKIARNNNEEFVDELRRLTERARRTSRRGRKAPLTDDQAEEAMIRAMSRFVVRDWRDIIDSAGDFGPIDNEIHYSPTMVYEVLKHDAYKNFRDWISDCAMDEETYAAKMDADDLKKSSPPQDSISQDGAAATSTGNSPTS